MNAAINVNVSVAVTASHATAISTPVVISRTSEPSPPAVRPQKRSPSKKYPKKPAGPCDGRHRCDGFARARKNPRGI
jgi:hypothetical protein